ncbi:MAG: hypothetical protein QOH24_1846 [Verrucomicrobiota bacterium]
MLAGSRAEAINIASTTQIPAATFSRIGLVYSTINATSRASPVAKLPRHWPYCEFGDRDRGVFDRRNLPGDIGVKRNRLIWSF